MNVEFQPLDHQGISLILKLLKYVYIVLIELSF